MIVVISKLIEGDEDLTDAYFGNKKNEFNDAIPQFSDNPQPVNESMFDTQPWSAEIGSGLVGVYKTVNGHTATYYAVARVDSSKRNAERLVYGAARALGLQVMQTEDVYAHVSKPEYMAKPTRAIADSAMYSNKHVVYAGPYHGFSVFDATNQVASKIPACTEKQLGNFQDYNLRQTRGFVWENEMEGEQHPLLKNGLFKNIDNQFLDDMREVGWKQTGVSTRVHLVPVLVKLSNPEVER